MPLLTCVKVRLGAAFSWFSWKRRAGRAALGALEAMVVASREANTREEAMVMVGWREMDGEESLVAMGLKGGSLEKEFFWREKAEEGELQLRPPGT